MSFSNYKLAKQDGVVYLYGHNGEVILSVTAAAWELIRKTEPTLTDQELSKQAFSTWMEEKERADLLPCRFSVWTAAIKWYRETDNA